MILDTGIKKQYSGRFFLKVENKETGETREYETENLVTDQGLERMATSSDYLGVCFVGSGSTPPSFSDSTLNTEIARVGKSKNWPNQGSSNRITAAFNADILDPYTYGDMPYVFAKGVAAGNITEIGIGWGDGLLYSRALILDDLGNPVAITVLPIEVLTVTYRHRHHAPTETTSQTGVVIGGNKGWTGDVLCKASQVWSSGNDWDQSFLWGHLLNHAETHTRGVSNTTQMVLYASGTGDLSAAITGSPAGLVDAPVKDVTAAYLGGLVVEHSMTLNVGSANFDTGIKSVRVQLGNTAYQFQFTPPIMKTIEDELTLVFRHTWGRR